MQVSIVTCDHDLDDTESRVFARETDAVQFVLDQQVEEDDLVVERRHDHKFGDNVIIYDVIWAGEYQAEFWKIETVEVIQELGPWKR